MENNSFIDNILNEITQLTWNEIRGELTNPHSTKSINAITQVIEELYGSDIAYEFRKSLLEQSPTPPTEEKPKEENPLEKDLDAIKIGMMTDVEKEAYLKKKWEMEQSGTMDLEEDIISEASFLDSKYKAGHQIIFNKETPPKWAPNLKNGDVLTILDDDSSIKTYGSGDFVKTLQLPNGNKVRVASSNRGGGNSELFIHSKGGGAEPKGEDWEALIICAHNGIDESSKEWARAKVFWSTYGQDAKKIADAFRGIIKSKKLSQLGSGTATTNPDWGGTDKTPKTDILGDSDEKISLKKSGGSQLMSASSKEAIATFNAAIKMVGENQPTSLKSFLDVLEQKMGKMSEKGTITALEKLRDSGETLTPSQEKAIAEMEKLQFNAKEITNDMQSIFKDMYFKTCFCFEAATGTNKFSDKNAVANQLIEFDPSGKVTAHLKMDSINDAKPLASKNSFYVAFKTSGANPQASLVLRSKQLSKSKLLENITFKDIVNEEFSKSKIGKTILMEATKQRIDEFALFNSLVKGLKNVTDKVKKQVENILNIIMSRVKEAISYIKSLGGKIFDAIMNFLGFEVSDVMIKSSGPFALV
jgi:hypothetical protein